MRPANERWHSFAAVFGPVEENKIVKNREKHTHTERTNEMPRLLAVPDPKVWPMPDVVPFRLLREKKKTNS